MVSTEPARPAASGPSKWASLVLRMDRRDLVGIVLGLAFTAWVVLTATQAGGRPWPLAGLVDGAVVAVIVGRILGSRRPLTIPILVATSPVVVYVFNREPLLGDGPLGYVNGSGALFIVAAAGAAVLASSSGHAAVRRAAVGVAAAWIVIPFITGARAAAIAGGALAVLVVLRSSTIRRAILLTGAALTIAGIVVPVVLGAAYEPGGRAGPTDRLVDASLGELRVVLWSEAAALVAENPLLGVGPGRFREVSPTAQSRDDADWVHNEYLQVATETGVPGGLLLLSVVAWGFVRLWSASANGRSVPAAIALGGLAVNASIDYVLHFPVLVICLGLLVGHASARVAGPPDVSRGSLSGSALGPVLATLLLWVVLLLPIGLSNPPYTVPNGAVRLNDGVGVHFTGAGGIVRSARPPESLYRRIVESEAVTVEMWVATRDVDQHGPARIVSASEGTINRNLTVGQDGDRLVFRLRTTETDWNGTDPHLVVGGVFRSTALQHVVVTTDVAVTSVFVDGELRSQWTGPGGELDGWIHTYPLLLGNERGGDRPWLGELRLVSIYDVTLSSEDVEATYNRGPPHAAGTAVGGTPPIAYYTFEEPGGTAVIDRSPAALGGNLQIPARYPTPSPDLMTVMGDVDDRPAIRVTTHALVFAGWTIPMVVAARRRHSLPVTALVVTSGGATIMVAASIARHAAGRDPSVVDVVGALIGCVAGCAVVLWLRRHRTAV